MTTRNNPTQSRARLDTFTRLPGGWLAYTSTLGGGAAWTSTLEIILERTIRIDTNRILRVSGVTQAWMPTAGNNRGIARLYAIRVGTGHTFLKSQSYIYREVTNFEVREDMVLWDTDSYTAEEWTFQLAILRIGGSINRGTNTTGVRSRLTVEDLGPSNF